MKSFPSNYLGALAPGVMVKETVWLIYYQASGILKELPGISEKTN